MADWYVDSANGSPGAGTTPGNAVNMLADVFDQADPGDTIWIARRHDEMTTPSLQGGTAVMKNLVGWLTQPMRIIGWPESGTTYYASRPAAGISAGWDAHTSTNDNKARIRMNQWTQTVDLTYPGPTTNCVPYYCYHGVIAANIYWEHWAGCGFFGLVNGQVVGKLFEFENCYIFNTAAAGPSYYSKRGHPLVFGESNPTVFYIDCKNMGQDGFLYRTGPSESYYLNGEYIPSNQDSIGVDGAYNLRWYENTKILVGNRVRKQGGEALGTEEANLPTHYFLSCWMEHRDTVGTLTDVTFYPAITNQPSYDPRTPIWVGSGYQSSPAAKETHKISLLSGTNVSGTADTIAHMIYENTALIRPTSSATHSISMVCDVYFDKNFTSTFDTAPYPLPIGRNGTSQFDDMFQPAWYTAGWPTRPNEYFCFQGVKDIPITISFYVCTTNFDYSKNTESFGGNDNDLVFRSGSHSVNATYLKADGTVGLKRGSWTLDGPPTTNSDWRRLTVTVTPDMETPIWVYLSVFYRLNSFMPFDLNPSFFELHIDPIPEIT